MSEYPFDLRGMQQSWEGNGSKNGGSEISGEFSLSQGVVIAEIEHHGHGDFKLKFVPTEGFSEGETTAAQIGGGTAAGFAAGATLGSIVPVAGNNSGRSDRWGCGLFGRRRNWRRNSTHCMDSY